MFARSCLTIALWCAALPAQANIPIESRPLTPTTPPVTQASIATATTDEQSSTLWRLYQQVQRLEEEIRLLRGRFESQEQQLSKTDKELKTRFTDLDQRFEQFKEQQAAVTATTATVAPIIAPVTTADSEVTSSSIPNTSVSTTTTPPPSTPAAGQPADDADKRAYVGAYEAYRVGGASKAVAPMKAFIQNYPNSVYVPNANYWLGEFYLASTPPDFANAKRSFTVVMQRYPKSAKASAAIYRLATMAEVDDQLSEATRLMQLLTKEYPNTQEAGYAATFLKSHNVKSSSNTKPTDKSTKPANTSNTTPRKPSATPSNPAKPRTPAV